MRQAAWEKLKREWHEDVPMIILGMDARELEDEWALKLPEDDIRPPVLVAMRDVMEVVCAVTGYRAPKIRSPRRGKHLSKRRHMVMMLIDRLCPKRSLPEIGRFMDRDHTTVMHALRSFPGALEDDPDLAHEYDQCCRHFGIKP